MNKNGIKQLPKPTYAQIATQPLQEFTAKISTLRRDVATGVPKRTLRGVFTADGEMFRDHCHVKETVKLQKILSKPAIAKTNKWVIISFKANVSTYQYGVPGTYPEVYKQTLDNIQDVKILGRA